MLLLKICFETLRNNFFPTYVSCVGVFLIFTTTGIRERREDLPAWGVGVGGSQLILIGLQVPQEITDHSTFLHKDSCSLRLKVQGWDTWMNLLKLPLYDLENWTTGIISQNWKKKIWKCVCPKWTSRWFQGFLMMSKCWFVRFETGPLCSLHCPHFE